MATAQVKFYAKNALPSENIDQNGLYFIRGGELYRGSTRFGCGRVTSAETEEALAALTGVARGDINVGYEGAKVYDGSAWQPLGGDTTSLTASWRADISEWTSGLAVGGAESIITQITQDAETGKVTASASAFPTLATGDADGEIKLGTQSASVAGWNTLVGRVSGIESIIDATNGGSVSASSGTFTNLTVTDTATFSVTSVSADSLTINGSTVEELADKQIAAISSATQSSTANGITVSVTTSGGSVTAVQVDAAAFGNVMHLVGVVSAPTEIAAPVGGDIVVIGSQPATGYVTGQEYIYISTTSTWEVIGDQSTYALNAYAPGTEVVTAGATTLPGAIHAIAAAVDALNSSVSDLASELTSLASGFSELGDAAQATVANTIDASAATLPTCSAVSDYIANAIAEALTWVEDPPYEDGTETNPWLIKSVEDLGKLKAAVEGTASADNPYGASDHYKLANDIDMDGVEWNGIGLQSPSTPKYDPDPDHTFKGTFDGDNHVIDNLTLHCVGGGTADRYVSFFRTAGYGATIKNLTINVDGVDNWHDEDIMASAIVGVTNGGLTIENCTANGTLGTLSEPLDNSSGILCRIAVPPAHQDPYTVTLTNVTNNVDIVGICKVGGIISYAYGTMNFNNVVNNGNLTRKGLDATRADGVGGLIGFGHQDGGHVNYNFNGVKNTGIITSDLTTYARYTG